MRDSVPIGHAYKLVEMETKNRGIFAFYWHSAFEGEIPKKHKSITNHIELKANIKYCLCAIIGKSEYETQKREREREMCDAKNYVK